MLGSEINDYKVANWSMQVHLWLAENYTGAVVLDPSSAVLHHPVEERVAVAP